MNHQIKMGGVTALLVCTLAIPTPSSAFNLVVENTTSGVSALSSIGELGQSFINDPFSPNGSGTGIDVFLNSFTFGFFNTSSQSLAAGKTLSIFNGTGNGGSLIASATSTATSAVSGISNPVTWTFANSVQLIETSNYTAVLRGVDSNIRLSASPLNSNPYPNGALTFDQDPVAFDTVFRANFTLETIPFEFNPAMGLGILGGVGWLHKRFKKG